MRASPTLKIETFVAGGILAGVKIDPQYDDLGRRDGLTLSMGAAALHSIRYGYDAASRLKTVTVGANKAEYGYEPLAGGAVATITLRHAGVQTLQTRKEYDQLMRLISIRTARSIDVAVLSSHGYVYNAANLSNEWGVLKSWLRDWHLASPMPLAAARWHILHRAKRGLETYGVGGMFPGVTLDPQHDALQRRESFAVKRNGALALSMSFGVFES